MRQQLSLFLPQNEREKVDRIRSKVDPKQFALIPAHLTLCRDDELIFFSTIEQRLLELAPFHLQMTFGPPEVLSDGCVLLRPVEGQEAYQEIRRQLLGSTASIHNAHITLLHPRHAEDAHYNLQEIRESLSDLVVQFQAISHITKKGDEPWRVQAIYEGNGP